MLNHISNSLVALYFLASVLSYYSQVFTLLLLKGTCSKQNTFKFLSSGVLNGKVRLCRDFQTDKCFTHGNDQS